MLIRIGQNSFEISEPYSAGHQLTAGEAQALNTLRSENIRNQLARSIAKMVHGGAPLDTAQLMSIKDEARVRDTNYKFEWRRQTPRLTPAAGTVEAEALLLADEDMTIWENQNGQRLDPAERQIRVETNAERPEVLARATERVEARRRVAAAGLADLLR